MNKDIFFCMVGLPLFDKESSWTPVFKNLVRALRGFLNISADEKSRRLLAHKGLRVRTKIIFFLFLNQTYVVGTQKNCLNETVLLSTQNICLIN